MKKKLVSLLLVFAMVLSSAPLSFAEGTEAGLENFKKANSYTPGMFQDVFSSDWYAENVIAAYQYGLVKGTTSTNFNPKGNITVAETIALACRLHNIYNGGTGEFTQGNPWYKVYVDYALTNKIMPGTYSDYNAKISRANFAYFLNNALPKEALKEINNIPNGALKDVAEDNKADAIYTLYRAGVLTGSDKYGTFNPNSNIQRSEVATIVTRMADRTQRKMFILEEKILEPEDVTFVGSAFYDEESKCFVLTKDRQNWVAGGIWYNLQCHGDFTLNLNYYTGSPERSLGGGDGLVIAFYANKEYQIEPVLGFTNKGYGIELDTWSNYNCDDPDGNHIALIKDDIGNHLVAEKISEIEDEKWHNLKIIVKNNICCAYVDGELKIEHEVKNTGYGWIGVTAGTGDAVNLHAVKDVSIHINWN